jgi:acetyltransferase-like isoleucine patch superfamily enzyme
VAYYSKAELLKIDFKSLGNDVRISKASSLDKSHQMEIGKNSRIDDFCALSGNISIGRNVHIAVHCSITASRELAHLEDFSGMAFSSHIFTSSDDYSGATMTNPTVPITFKNIQHGAVSLGRHVIVGSGTMIFPGVKIAEGCAISALSIVNKSTEPWGIYFGTPARRLKDRSKKLLELERQYLNESPDNES